MRKWRFTRPAASPLATALLALVIAVAAHAVLLLPDYRTPRDNTAFTTSGIQMLNVSSLPPEQQKKFQNWLSVHDPAQAARSHSRSGYSAVLKNKTQINVHVEPYHPAEVRSQLKLTPFSQVPTGGLPQKSLPQPREKKIPQRPERTAVIFDESGNKIAHSMGVIPDRLGSNRPTVISVTGFGRVSGITVARSSGNRELDILALNAVFKLDLKKNTALIVIWPGKENK